MRFRHALVITVLKLAGFKIHKTMQGRHFVFFKDRAPDDSAYFIEDLY